MFKCTLLTKITQHYTWNNRNLFRIEDQPFIINRAANRNVRGFPYPSRRQHSKAFTLLVDTLRYRLCYWAGNYLNRVGITGNWDLNISATEIYYSLAHGHGCGITLPSPVHLKICQRGDIPFPFVGFLNPNSLFPWDRVPEMRAGNIQR